MILYTVLDVESCLRDEKEEVPQYEEVLVDSVPVLVKRHGTDIAIIDRVLSTNPTDFLNPDLSPGTRVTAVD